MDKNVRKQALIMAGGTGGHVYPALALARELVSRDVGVAWLGTAAGIEARLVPEANYPLHTLAVSGIRGKGAGAIVKAPLNVSRAILQARRVIADVKPQVVVGLGGFASGPGGVAAKIMRRPLVIHEQNAVAGTTNRLLGKIADVRLVAFENALPASTCIGNPVRAEIEQLKEPAARFADRMGPIRLLVLGGSLGATAINEMLPQALTLLPQGMRPQVRHQAGEKHLDAARIAYEAAGVDAEVKPFIADMAEALGWADMAVCRAGALTVSELAAAGLGALLIPFPHAIDDHQTANAAALVERGAAVLKQQRELTPASLAKLLTQLIADRAQLLKMAESARSLAVGQSAQRFADECMELING